MDIDGFRFVTATTVFAGGECNNERLNFCGLVIHSFHRLTASSLALTNLEMFLVLDSYHKIDKCSLLVSMYTFRRLV